MPPNVLRVLFLRPSTVPERRRRIVSTVEKTAPEPKYDTPVEYKKYFKTHEQIRAEKVEKEERLFKDYMLNLKEKDGKETAIMEERRNRPCSAPAAPKNNSYSRTSLTEVSRIPPTFRDGSSTLQNMRNKEPEKEVRANWDSWTVRPPHQKKFQRPQSAVARRDPSHPVQRRPLLR